VSVGVVWNRAARRAPHIRLHRLFPDAEVVAPTSHEEAVAATRELAGRHETIVAVGGDGAVHAVINGLAGTEAALGLIPAGTGNILATALRIPVNDHRLAARICLGDVETVIDLGECGNRRFAASIGYGFDGRVIGPADRLKPFFGRGAFIVAALGLQFTTEPWQVKAYSDGEVRYDGEAVLAAVVNVGKYGGLLRVSDRTSGVDGLLDLAVLRPGRWPKCGMVGPAVRGLLSAADRSGRVEVFRGTEFRLEVSPVPVAQIDGEPWEAPSYTVKAVPKALRVKTAERLPSV
jgi:diacylglycerol kinase (ATP)